MLRWETLPIRIINGRSVRMHRPLFTATETQDIEVGKKTELDALAFKHLKSELFSYRLLDINFVRLYEERHNLKRLKFLKMPISASGRTEVAI